MKIIQVYWPSSEVSDGSAPWLSRRHECMSIALSCLLLKRWYAQVELVTNPAGKKLLIDQLRLPYSRVIESDLAGSALEARLRTIAAQTEPFVYVAPDVFVFAPFPTAPATPALLALHPIQDHTGQYRQVLSQWPELLARELPDEPDSAEPTIACNLSVLGSYGGTFAQQYARQALTVLSTAPPALLPSAADSLGEVLPYRLARQAGLPIHYLVPYVSKTAAELLRFDQVPVLASTIRVPDRAKADAQYQEQVEARLRHHFPRQYGRLVRLLGLPAQPELPAPTPAEVVFFGAAPFAQLRQHLHRYQPARSVPAQVRIIPQAVMRMVDGATQQFLQDLLQVEHVCAQLRRRQTSYATRRARLLRAALRLLDHTTREQLLATHYTLAADVCLLETRWPLAVLAATAASLPAPSNYQLLLAGVNNTGPYLEDLQPWDIFLTCFQGTTCTGYELVAIIESNEQYRLRGSAAEEYVLQFICRELVFQGRLQPAEAPVAATADATFQYEPTVVMG